MPKISIIVPVYNVEKYLAKCLDSLVNQTLKDIEIIVVDDGSPDESYKIYQAYAEKDDRIKYIRKENAGVSEARNTGLTMSTGQFVMFVDSDDWMELNGCEVLYNEYERTHADMILADAIILTDEVPERNYIFDKPFTTDDISVIRDYQKACIGYCYNTMPKTKWNIPGLGSPWNKLFRRDIIEKYEMKFDPYVLGIYDDNLFTLYYLSHCLTLSYIQEPVYDFRIVTTSLTQGYKANTLDINRRIFERIDRFIDYMEDESFFREAFYVYVIRRFSKSLNVYFFAKQNKKDKKEIYKELKETMQTSPYKEAIAKVDRSRLLKNHRMVVRLARIGSPRLIHLAVNFKDKRKKHA